MKKHLYLFAAAAVALASCSSDDTLAENSSANQQKEIAFSAITQPNTRAAVDGTTFTPNTMIVTAYDVTNTREFFEPTTFTKASTTWKGGKYWPLSATYINFWAYSELQASATPTLTWDATATTATWALVMTDNKTSQKDLMYAIGNGEVTQTANTLSFNDGNPVSMTFKHAQAWIRFMVDAYDATSGGKITLNSITLNGAKYNGTYTITFTNFNDDESQAVAGAWSSLGSTADVEVPNWTPATVAYDSEGDGVYVGDGLLIVPDDNAATADFTSFTIDYTLDGNDYTYTYTPATAAAANVDQAKKYTFKINFHLHEIEVAPDVTDWVEGGPTAVSIY